MSRRSGTEKRKRQYLIGVRFNDGEYEFIRARADDWGVSLAQAVRMLMGPPHRSDGGPTGLARARGWQVADWRRSDGASSIPGGYVTDHGED